MSELAKRCYQKVSQSVIESNNIVCNIGAVYFFNKADLKRANVKTLIRSISDQLRDTVKGFTKQLFTNVKLLPKDKSVNNMNEFYLRKLTVEELFDTLIGTPCLALQEQPM